jgi:hypothetical protein
MGNAWDNHFYKETNFTIPNLMIFQTVIRTDFDSSSRLLSVDWVLQFALLRCHFYLRNAAEKAKRELTKKR